VPSDVPLMLTYCVVRHTAIVCDDHDIPPTVEIHAMNEEKLLEIDSMNNNN
jgi:hypothetical protein